MGQRLANCYVLVATLSEELREVLARGEMGNGRKWILCPP
jgi:hypothetical protein